MADLVEETKPTPLKTFATSEPIINKDVLPMTGDEAFAWLLHNFKRYMHNEIIWIDVRSLFVTADAWKTLHAVPKIPLSPWETIEKYTNDMKEMLDE